VRGRKPVPVEQRRLEGQDVSHRPLPQAVLVGGRPETLERPAGLPKEAWPFWEESVGHLVNAGIADRVDLPALTMLATLYARYIQARKIIAKDGLLAIGSSGQFVEHPAVKIERNSMKMFLTAAEQYGIGPVARTRLGLADLHRRNMAAELERALGGGESAPPDLDLPEAEVVEDDDVGLPV